MPGHKTPKHIMIEEEMDILSDLIESFGSNLADTAASVYLQSIHPIDPRDLGFYLSKFSKIKMLKIEDSKFWKHTDIPSVDLNVQCFRADNIPIDDLSFIKLGSNLTEFDVRSSKYGSIRCLNQLLVMSLNKFSIRASQLPLENIAFLSGVNLLKSIKLENIIFPDAAPKLDFKQFPILKHLSLAKSGIKSVSHIQLPDQLKSLDLSRNQIEDISPLRLNSGLESLDLSSNKIENLDHVVFPSNLCSLNVSMNKLTSLATMVFPTSLLELNSKKNRIQGSTDFSALSSLIKLVMALNPVKYENVKLPKNLQILDMSGCLFASHTNMEWPHTLKELDISSCKMSDQFPDGLEKLNLSNNYITGFPEKFALPSNLKYLNMHKNSLTSFPLHKSPSSLKFLDLSSNNFDDYKLPDSLNTFEF